MSDVAGVGKQLLTLERRDTPEAIRPLIAALCSIAYALWAFNGCDLHRPRRESDETVSNVRSCARSYRPVAKAM